MFEKEAEEWIKENMDCCRTESCTGKDIPYFDEEERCCAKSAFKDGAEFGFQKGIKAKINTTTISDYPIKDEWHYVKESDYPEEYEDLWICFITEDFAKDYVRGWYEYDSDNDKHIFKYVNEIGTHYLKDVYAWQTLIPPKE